MKFSKNRRLGNIGEDYACEILRNLNHLILARNYLKRVGEIDIVAQKDDILMFFEVKTIIYSEKPNEKDVSRATYRPEYNISNHKLIRINRVIQCFINEFSHNDIYWECHAISILLDKDLNLKNYYIIRNINIC